MRLMAREEDIYKLMDARDHCLCGAGACFIAAMVSVYLLMQRPSWDIIYFLAVSVIGFLLLLYYIWKNSGRIMEAGCCYMEIDGESLSVCQPEQNGQYESCRIFYNEVEKIVEGSRKGIPEFYVVTCLNPERESFILLNEEEQMRRIFCVRSLGYGNQEFKEFYRRMCWEVPEKVQIFGTKYQTAWDRKKSRGGLYLMAVLVLCYAIVKALLVFRVF